MVWRRNLNYEHKRPAHPSRECAGLVRMRLLKACLQRNVAEWADKPGSVVGRPFIFCLRCRRSHSQATRTRAGPAHGVPICPFSRWGLPSRAVADALVRSYHTVSAFLPPEGGGVFFSVALSVGSPRPAVSRHLALWSPDFPHRGRSPQRGRLAHSASCTS